MNSRALVLIPSGICRSLGRHLFHGDVEQGAFLFADAEQADGRLILRVVDVHLVPEEAWNLQTGWHLDLSDEERLKVMLMAREKDAHLIECHSHRDTRGPVGFSYSDLTGLDELLPYVRWKLPGKTYTALVWGNGQVAGRVWIDPPAQELPLEDVKRSDAAGRTRPVRFYEPTLRRMLARAARVLTGWWKWARP